MSKWKSFNCKPNSHSPESERREEWTSVDQLLMVEFDVKFCCSYSELKTEWQTRAWRKKHAQTGRVTDRQIVGAAVWVSSQIPHRLSGSEQSQRSSSPLYFVSDLLCPSKNRLEEETDRKMSDCQRWENSLKLMMSMLSAVCLTFFSKLNLNIMSK